MNPEKAINYLEEAIMLARRLVWLKHKDALLRGEVGLHAADPSSGRAGMRLIFKIITLLCRQPLVQDEVTQPCVALHFPGEKRNAAICEVD